MMNIAIIPMLIAAENTRRGTASRTARLCADFILQRDGYSPAGFLTPEEQYAENLDSYYRALNLVAYIASTPAKARRKRKKS